MGHHAIEEEQVPLRSEGVTGRELPHCDGMVR
jgi:hypothetical protein